MKKIWNRICKVLSIKNITILSIAIFVLMMLPICYCSFVNRATGDDYGYAALTKYAWDNSHSLISVFKASWETIKNYYVEWQGTWFSIFLFTLQPEVFNEKAYVSVVFLMSFLWIFSTFLMFGKILKDKLKLDKLSIILLITIYLVICFSFIPSKKSSIFWYNGCAHYMVPFAMCQIVVYWLLKYIDEYKYIHLIAVTIFMGLLGGANYQAALFAMIVSIYIGLMEFFVKRNKKVLLLLIPLFLETVGLLISMKSPGNSVRGGEEFGFSIAQVVDTIIMSFVSGIKDMGDYFKTYPMIYVGIVVMFFVMLEAVRVRKEVQMIQYPGLLILAVFCLYCAMQAPAIYARVDVSGGVYNMNFLLFMYMMFTIVSVLAEKVGAWVNKNSECTWNNIHARVIIPGLMFCMVLVFACRDDIKETTTWMCVEYVTSGQAEDYKKQMEQLTELMTNDGVQDVVVPFINDYQGPLMHMPVTDDAKAWTNTVICKYYGKNSVVAIPRDEWEKNMIGEKNNFMK